MIGYRRQPNNSARAQSSGNADDKAASDKLVGNLLDDGRLGAPILPTPFNYHHGLVLAGELENRSFYGSLASTAPGKEP